MSHSSVELLPGADALICCVEAFLSAGDDSLIAVLDNGTRRVPIDRLQYSVLHALAQPCLPSDVDKRFWELGWTEEECSELPDIIDELTTLSCVRSLADALEALCPDGVAAAVLDRWPALPQSLCIPTADRPEVLARALASWGAFFTARGTTAVNPAAAVKPEAATPDGEASPAGGAEAATLSGPCILVIDDSRRLAAETRAVCERFEQSFAGRVLYYDRSAREAYITRLLEQLSSQASESPEFSAAAYADALRFSLGLPSSRLPNSSLEALELGSWGAARNFALLLLAGIPFCMADDDTLPEFHVHPQADPQRIAFSADYDPVYRQVCPDIDAALSFGGRSGATAAAVYGFSGSGLQAPLPLDLSGCDYPSLRRIFSPDARITVFCFGLAGDAGSGNSAHLLFRPQKSQPELLLSKEAWEMAKSSRWMLRYSPASTVGGGLFMSTHALIDARYSLPPFPPFCRVEDKLWGVLLRLLHGEQLMLHSVYAVTHIPGEQRGPAEAKALLPANDVLLDILLSIRERAVARKHPFHTEFARELSRLALASQADFKAFAAEALQASLWHRIQSLEEILQGQALPDYQERDTQQLIQELQSQMDEPSFRVPEEFNALPEAFFEYSAAFAELLRIWPALFTAAGELARPASHA